MTALYIFGAKYLFLISVILFGFLFLVIKRAEKRRFLILTAISFILAYLIAKLSGLLFYDPRAFVVGGFMPLISHAADNGFPSDHALLTGPIAAVGYVFERRWGLALWLLAILVGLSRVVVGVHHLIDILGSFVIAILAVYIVNRFLERYPRRT